MDKKQALISFLSENSDRATRFAYTFMRNREDAEDVVCESVVKALRAVNRLESTQYIRCWFYKIIKNTALTYLSKNHASFTDIDELSEVLSSQENFSDLGFEDLIRRLPEKYRTIIICRFFEDMKIKEIALAMELSESTVKTRLYRALELLKADIRSDFNE